MTQAELRENMKFMLRKMNTTGQPITNATVHQDILPETNMGPASPRRVYKAFIRYSIVTGGGQDKPWPSDWVTKSVEVLAAGMIP